MLLWYNAIATTILIYLLVGYTKYKNWQHTDNDYNNNKMYMLVIKLKIITNTSVLLIQ